MFRFARIAVVFACCLVTVCAATPALRVRAQVSVAGPVVRLGDLLASPDAAPPDVRLLVLAASPQPGVPLRWTGRALAARLRSAGLSSQDFLFPPRIVVRRQAHPMPRAAVLAAVSAYLHRPVSAQDVRYAAPLTTSSTPDVVVLRAVRDALQDRLDVFCRARHDPQLLPFVVSVRLTGAEREQAVQQRRQSAFVYARPSVPSRPVLVRPGHNAVLVIASPGFAMTTLVAPLQPGRQGDHIRVRSLATKAILQVVVSGPNAVAALPQSLTGAGPVLSPGGDHGSR
ncbi:MAG: flagella basal body P-ring formation protein FlgA [Terriglobales bacterium]